MLTAGRLNVLLSLQRFERAACRPKLAALIVSGLLWLAIIFAAVHLL